MLALENLRVKIKNLTKEKANYLVIKLSDVIKTQAIMFIVNIHSTSGLN
jgi:hypothetical protein